MIRTLAVFDVVLSGLCIDDSSLKHCCEVPTTVSGVYYVDSDGDWY
jgi:hypothetical protein